MKPAVHLRLFPALAFLLLAFVPHPGRASTDLAKQFLEPPIEYHTFPCWWFDGGDPITDERVDWQLEQLDSQGIDVVCVSYVGPHGVRPPVGSELWWERLQHIVEKAASLGMQIWMVDGIGWGSPMTNNLVTRSDPSFRGFILEHRQKRVTGPGVARIELPAGQKITEVVGAYAYPVENGQILLSQQRDILAGVKGNSVAWDAPAGEWLIVFLYSRPGDDSTLPSGSPPNAFGRGESIDYMNPAAMEKLLEVSVGEYEKRFPEHYGTTIVASFQDEVLPSHGFPPVSDFLFEQFEKRKGYDLKPNLVALFTDVGKLTPKVRCDYYDIWVELMEEAYFKPQFEWYEKRGVKIAHDQFGRQSLRDQVWRYGDYFKTMRWYQIPGMDDWYEPRLRRNIRDIKMASSVAHLYERPQVFCEALHSAGWGITIGDQRMVANEEYVLGVNLYNEILFNYTTHGSWFEFAPSPTMFRQPYFRHKHLFNEYINRLSLIMSQGHHVADVAIFYPVTSMQENMPGAVANDTAELINNTFFQLGETLFYDQIDFDYIDDDSIQRAETSQGRLDVAGESYRILILPPLTNIRRGTLRKIRDFQESGGMVVAVTFLPASSPDAGRDDPEVIRDVQAVFGSAPSLLNDTRELHLEQSRSGGRAFFLPTNFLSISHLIKHNHSTDLVTGLESILANHRRIDGKDFYLLFNASEESVKGTVKLRALGQPKVWDPETGEIREFFKYRQEKPYTALRIELEPFEARLIEFDPDQQGFSLTAGSFQVTSLTKTAGESRVRGWTSSPGSIEVELSHDGQAYTGREGPGDLPPVLQTDNEWGFSIEPTMDNQWGDFRLPVTPRDEVIGAEIRQFQYRQEEESEDGLALGWGLPAFDASPWENTLFTVGPYWWVIRPFPTRGAVAYFDKQFVSEPKVDVTATYQHGDRTLRWEPYSFSQLFGIHKDPRYFGIFGLDHYNRTYSDFIDLGASESFGIAFAYTQVYSPTDMRAILKHNVGSYMEPARVWVNQQRVSPHWGLTHMVGTLPVELKEGWNEILIKLMRLNRSTRFYVHLEPYGEDTSPSSTRQPGPRLTWFAKDSPFVYDLTPDLKKRIGWYRFQLPPGTEQFDLDLYGRARAFVDGEEVPVGANGFVLLPEVAREGALCALRIEQEQGRYAGAAFRSPVRLRLSSGRITLGDWSGATIRRCVNSIGGEYPSGLI